MIFNLGSINADYFYEVPHLPQPGETLPATAFSTGLGGKGANISVAAARAGSHVRHIGAVGPDGAWAVERLASYGVNVANVATVTEATGHAVITIDSHGENAIVIFSGANRKQSETRVEAALMDATAGDFLVLQNETNSLLIAASFAKKKGMRVLYVAAPFDQRASLALLDHTDVLVLNEIELKQLEAATNKLPAELGVDMIIVTRGKQGARLFERSNDWAPKDFVSQCVEAVDTTGAGDTFTGYLVAGLDSGMLADHAVARAVSAAALKVTRKGTADAIPLMKEVQSFMT